MAAKCNCRHAPSILIYNLLLKALWPLKIVIIWIIMLLTKSMLLICTRIKLLYQNVLCKACINTATSDPIAVPLSNHHYQTQLIVIAFPTSLYSVLVVSMLHQKKWFIFPLLLLFLLLSYWIWLAIWYPCHSKHHLIVFHLKHVSNPVSF